MVALLGADGLAVRVVGASVAQSDWRRFRGFLKWSISTVSLSAAIAALIIAGAALFAGPYRSVLLLGAFAVPLLAGLYLIRGVNQGAAKIVAAQLPMDVTRWIIALSLIAILLLTRLNTSAVQILGIVLAAYAVSLVIAAIALRRHIRDLPKLLPSDGALDRWLAASLPFLTVALLGVAATEMNTLLLGAISGPRDAGLYQPIARIAPLMPLAKEAIEMPLAPRIAAFWESGNRLELGRLIRRATIASTFATTLVVIAILLASPFIFAAFGHEFEAVRTYLYWVAAAHITNAVFGPSAVLLAMAGDMRRRIQAQAVTLAVQAVLTLTLVPLLGVKGAAIALSLQIVAWASVNWLLARRSTHIDASVFSAVRRGYVSLISRASAKQCD
jgi:O-antigen/teichoic acid export membrane protein